MSKIYCADAVMVVTLYVIADSEAEARSKVDRLRNHGLTMDEQSDPFYNLAVTGMEFEDMLTSNNVAEVTMSPAATLVGPIDLAAVTALGAVNRAHFEEIEGLEA